MIISKKNVSLLFVSFWLSTGYGQIPKPELPDYLIEKPKPIEENFPQAIDVVPEFPDGYVAFKRYLFSKLRYPKTIAKLISKNKLRVEFRIDPDGRLRQLIVTGVLNSRIKKDMSNVFSTMPSFKIRCANCWQKHYWFSIDDELICHVDKEKPKVYLLIDGGQYWVLNVEYE